MPKPVEFENLLSYQNRMKEAELSILFLRKVSALNKKVLVLAGHFTAAITLCSEIRTDLD